MIALRAGLLVNMLKYKARLKQMNSVYFLEAKSLTGSIQIQHKANHKSNGPIFRRVLPKMPPPAAKCRQGQHTPRPAASDQQNFFEARVS